jgi:hypothetical protein
MVTSTVVQASNGSTPQPLLAEEMGCTGMSSSQALQHQVHDESRETRHEAVAGDTRDDAVRDSSNGARGNADQAPHPQAQMSSFQSCTSMSSSRKNPYHAQDQSSAEGNLSACDSRGTACDSRGRRGNQGSAEIVPKPDTNMSNTSMSSSQQHLRHAQDQSNAERDLGACESRGIASDSRGRRGDQGSEGTTFTSEMSMRCSAHVQLNVQDEPRVHC